MKVSLQTRNVEYGTGTLISAMQDDFFFFYAYLSGLSIEFAVLERILLMLSCISHTCNPVPFMPVHRVQLAPFNEAGESTQLFTKPLVSAL